MSKSGTEHSSLPAFQKPASIAELAEKIRTGTLWNDGQDLKHWLRVAERHRRNGKRLLEQHKDIERAFVALGKAATLVLEKMPLHPEYYTMLTTAQRTNLTLNGRDIVDHLTVIRPILLDRFYAWSKLNQGNGGKGLGALSRLKALRTLLEGYHLDCYVIPSADAHGSLSVADSDKRREFISRVTTPAANAIVTRSRAYIVIPTQYWEQARDETDDHWTLVCAGSPPNGPKDWVEWLSSRCPNNSRVGIDARMISSGNAWRLNSLLKKKNSELVDPHQNLVDLVWNAEGRRTSSSDTVWIQPIGYGGMHVARKIARVQYWLHEESSRYSELGGGDRISGMLITALDQITYLLNLRNYERPDGAVFHVYLFIGLERVVLFLDEERIGSGTARWLDTLSVERQNYGQVWDFLEKGEYGNGGLIISPRTSYAISLMLTPERYVLYQPSEIEELIMAEEQMHNVSATLPPSVPTHAGNLSPHDLSRTPYPPTPPPLAHKYDASSSPYPQSLLLATQEHPSLGTRGPLQAVSTDNPSLPLSATNTSRVPDYISDESFSVHQSRRCRPVEGESPPPMFMPGLPSLESLSLQSTRSSTHGLCPSPVSWEGSRYESGMESPALEPSYRGYEESLRAQSLYNCPV